MGSDEYKVGFGKPPLHTRFAAGVAANPNGKTSEQKRLEMRNAEAAMRIRARLLEEAENAINERSGEQALAMIEAAMLKLLKDSEDRGLGAPKAAVDHTSSDGTMTPRDASAAVLAALQRKHDAG